MTDDDDLPAGVEQALVEIERQARAARGQRVDDEAPTPWDFQLPTAADLRRLREQCGLSREEAAEMMDYQKRTVASYESGGGSHAAGYEFVQTALRLYKREWPR